MSGSQRCDEILRLIDEVLGADANDRHSSSPDGDAERAGIGKR